VKEIRSCSIDVIALQEVNPACSFSKRLAKELSFDEIHQVCNGGMKLLGLGIPTNLTEGIAILAHPRFLLKEQETFKIQGGFGIYGDIATIHLSESNFALVGTIKVEDRPIVVTNVHLKATLPLRVADTLEARHREGRITDESYAGLLEQLKDEAAEREESFQSFLDEFHDRYATTPVILLGDLNAEPSSPEVRLLVKEWKYRDACGLAGDDCDTWSASRNTNARFSAKPELARGEKKEEYDLFASAYDLNDRRIDYVFLNRFFDSSAVSNAGIFLD
jgi:endonuclease/exonuclease/phosphatase family metal-dependent hydrolase